MARSFRKKNVLFSLYFKWIALYLLLFGIHNISFCQSNTQKINKLQEQLTQVKGKEKVNLLNRLASLYHPTDSTKAYNYFKKALIITERFQYDYLEYKVFIYLTAGYNGSNKHPEAINILKKALQFAQKNNFAKAVGFAHSALGRQYLYLNDYQPAEEQQKTALKIFEKLNSDLGKSVVYERLGIVYMTKDDYIEALKYYYPALSIHRRLKLKSETGVSLYHIGLTKLELSDYHEAVDYILQSLTIWDQLDNIPNQWNCNELIGNIYIKLGDYAKALEYHRKALSLRMILVEPDIKRGIKPPPIYMLGLAYSYNNIAEVYLNLKQYDSAYYYALKGLNIKTAKNSVASKNDVANSQSNLGNIYCRLKKYDSAFYMLNNAAVTYQSLQNRSAYAEALYGLGVLNVHLKKYSKAKIFFMKGLKASREVGDKFDVEKGYKHLSDLYTVLHNYENALHYYRYYTQKKDSILNIANQNKIDELEIRYSVEKKEQEISQQKTVIRQKKKQVFLLLLAGILLLSLMALIVIFISITKKQKEKILRKENENLQKELELKNKDLVCNVSKIFTKNQMINRVAHRLINSSEDFKQANRKLIRGIVNELKQNMDETGWQEFEVRFARVHEGFYNRLDEQFPDLTKTERKLCALLKLGMSSKEIAAITMIRSESVDTGRSRLRKKLGLSNNDSLSAFLKRI